MKHWTGSSIEEDMEDVLCSTCGRETNNLLGICDSCLEDQDEDNIIENGELIEDNEEII